MILVGEYYSKDVYNEWYHKTGLPFIKEIIKKHNLLHSMFNRHDYYEIKKSENIILTFCLPDFQGKIRPHWMNKLDELETALKIADFDNWNNRDKNYLISQITSNSFLYSGVIVNELITYYYLVNKMDSDKIKLYPKISDRKISDILIHENDFLVYIEIGNLGINEPTKKIQKILNQCAKYLGEKIKNIHIKLEIDTYGLPLNENGYIDVKTSVEKICEEIDRLNLDSLKPINNYVLIKDILYYLKNKALFKPLIGELSFMPSLDELLQEKYFIEWIEKNENQIIKDFKILTTFYTYPLDHEYVEIHTEYQFPSNSATLIQSSYINQIKRHIDGQLYQINKNHANIISIECDYLNMFAIDYKYFVDKKLIIKIKQHMKEKNNVFLSGVILYNETFDKSIYISNQTIEKRYQISNSDLNKIGLNVIY